MTKRSIATVSLSGSLDEKLRAIAGAGFDAVEIFENDLLTFNGSPRDFRAALPATWVCGPCSALMRPWSSPPAL